MSLSSLLSQPSALLVVDMQNDFCHPQGGFAKRGVQLSPPVNELVDNLDQLIAGARAWQVPIFFIRMENGVWTDSPSWRQRVKVGPSAQELPTCAEGSWGAEFHGVAPTSDDRLIVKHRYSAFVDTELDLCLRALEVRTLVVAGVVTNVCVESTARDAFMKDYFVVTAADCCAANSQQEHDAALFTLDRYFGSVASSEDILRNWKEVEKREAVNQGN
ncbi:MAG: isochorismatase family cysteine hydrolase [Aquisalimonadaceae bacterium]